VNGLPHMGLPIPVWGKFISPYVYMGYPILYVLVKAPSQMQYRKNSTKTWARAVLGSRPTSDCYFLHTAWAQQCFKHFWLTNSSFWLLLVIQNVTHMTSSAVFSVCSVVFPKEYCMENKVLLFVWCSALCICMGHHIGQNVCIRSHAPTLVGYC